jgi:hypothetical protein
MFLQEPEVSGLQVNIPPGVTEEKKITHPGKKKFHVFYQTAEKGIFHIGDKESNGFLGFFTGFSVSRGIPQRLKYLLDFLAALQGHRFSIFLKPRNGGNTDSGSLSNFPQVQNRHTPHKKDYLLFQKLSIF